MSDDPPPDDPAPDDDDLPWVVHRYTRRQAIADGVLVDLSAWAREVGFRFPVACTAAVWHGHVVPPPGAAALGQDERGRAHDLLWVLRRAIAALPAGGDPAAGPSRLAFAVAFVTAAGRPETAQLVAVCGPGDDAEPVITVMLPGED